MNQRIIFIVLIISISLNIFFAVQHNIGTEDQNIKIENNNIEKISDYSKEIYNDSFNKYLDSKRITGITEKVDSIVLETYSNILSSKISHSDEIANIINDYFNNINLILQNNYVLERSTSVFPKYLNESRNDLLIATKDIKYFSENTKKKILYSIIQINQSVIRTIYGETNNKFFTEFLVFDSFKLDILNLKQMGNNLTGEIMFSTRPIDSIFELFIGEEIVSNNNNPNTFLDTLSIDRNNMEFKYTLNRDLDSLDFWIYINQGIIKYCYNDKVKINKN